MIFWIGLALMTAVAALAVLAPLMRGRSATGPAEGGDLAVYKDQLAEIVRDRDAGLIGTAEAEAARVEVARRLLKAERSGIPAAAGGAPGWRRAVIALVIIAIPALSLALYLKVGRPEVPDEPLAVRAQRPLDQLRPEELVARMEAAVVANPDDGKGWDLIARVYFRLGRMEEAANALRNVIRVLGSSAERQAMLGEALVNANEGVVTADAREAFEAALKVEPKALSPRMFLTLGLEQDGKKDEALASWNAILSEAKGTEPWIKIVKDQIARLEGREPEPEAPPQLSAEDKVNVEGMVSRLAERLQSDGGTVDEWVRLMRSYQVLGRPDDARATLAKARIAMKDKADALSAFEDAARQLGVKE
jgi:cytochrome c-type biogenesis protein CcmH